MTDPIRTDLIARLDARAVLERLIEALDDCELCWNLPESTLDAARAALAESQGEGPRLCWTENLPPSESCPYDHCIAETPFGRFLITWKSWKEYDSPTVDETPWGDWHDAFNSIDEAKAACQREFDQRLARCGRAALATAVDGPAVPEGREPASVVGKPSDDELESVACAVDPEHQGEDRQMLHVFYSACMSEGGTADEMHLRGLRAVLARWGHPAPQPPAEGEVWELVAALQADANLWRELGEYVESAKCRRAAELLQQREADIQSLEQELETERLRLAVCGVIAMSDTPESAARNRACHPEYWSVSADDITRQIDELMRLRAQQTPVPVSERPWESEGWCDENGWCWFGCHGEVWQFCHPNDREIYTVSLPAHALPLPKGEVE